MITWMQKHRKYLVVTIWISTIAFVGAGFVGWGSFNYGSLSSNVATVGDIKITKDEFVKTYSKIFNNYNSMLGGKLGEKEAKEMGIDKMAVQSLISQALLENFAAEFDIRIADSEVLEKIAQIKQFQVNGAFSKQKYLDTLKENRLKADEYEAGLKKYLLMQKVSDLVKPQVCELEAKAIGNASFGADNLEIKVIKLSDMKVEYSEADVKALWEKNKQSFQSKPSYDMEVATVKFAEFKNSEDELKKAFAEYGSNFKDQNGTALSYEKAKTLVNIEETKKKAKKEALKKFISLKNGEIHGVKLSKVALDSNSISLDMATELSKIKDADNIKPIETPEGYTFAKVTKVYKSEVLPYEQAKNEVAMQLKSEKASQKLRDIAKEESKSFSGVKIGFVTKADVKKLVFLAPEESQKFLGELFSAKNDSGFVIFPDKAILYKISEQKLLENNEFMAKKEFLNANILPFKNSIVTEGILENLKKRYEVKMNMEIGKN